MRHSNLCANLNIIIRPGQNSAAPVRRCIPVARSADPLNCRQKGPNFERLDCRKRRYRTSLSSRPDVSQSVSNLLCCLRNSVPAARHFRPTVSYPDAEILDVRESRIHHSRRASAAD